MVSTLSPLPHQIHLADTEMAACTAALCVAARKGWLREVCSGYLHWDAMRCDAMRCDAMRWGGVGWDGMEWDGMGLDGMGSGVGVEWDAIGWDGIGSDRAGGGRDGMLLKYPASTAFTTPITPDSTHIRRAPLSRNEKHSASASEIAISARMPHLSLTSRRCLRGLTSTQREASMITCGKYDHVW